MTKQKKKVAFLGMGGLGLPSYLALLERLGDQFDLFIFSEYNTKKIRNSHFRIIKVPIKNRPKRWREFLFFLMVFWGFIRNKFSVIHCQSSFPMGVTGILMGKLFRKKVIISFNGAELIWIKDIDYGFLKHKNSSTITRWVIKKADTVIALSEFHSGEIKKNLIFDREIKVIPRGIDLNKFPFKPKEKSNELVLICVGYLHPVKNPIMMLEVFEKLIEKTECTLIHIGEDHMGGEIQNLAKSKGLDEKITFKGSIPNEELFQYYHEADFLIHTSWVETQGIVFCEAMACGVPCVATHTGLFADLQNIVCKTVEQKDAIAMAETIYQLTKNPAETETMIKNGRHWIENNHLGFTVKRIVELYSN
jgi:glycosyltransferase involved in cell wall biosynthesis